MALRFLLLSCLYLRRLLFIVAFDAVLIRLSELTGQFFDASSNVLCQPSSLLLRNHPLLLIFLDQPIHVVLYVGLQGFPDSLVLVHRAVSEIDVVSDEIAVELEGLLLEIPLL